MTTSERSGDLGSGRLPISEDELTRLAGEIYSTIGHEPTLDGHPAPRAPTTAVTVGSALPAPTAAAGLPAPVAAVPELGRVGAPWGPALPSTGRRPFGAHILGLGPLDILLS